MKGMRFDEPAFALSRLALELELRSYKGLTFP